MTIPMLVLGALSLFGGYLLIYGGGMQHWLTPSVGPSIEEGVHTVSPTVLTFITLLVVARRRRRWLGGLRPQADPDPPTRGSRWSRSPRAASCGPTRSTRRC